ncbi:MAG: metallophosphoesterase family protein [Pseudomonadota bacterium]
MPNEVFVIPDIHGHLEKLTEALALVEAHAGSYAKIVFLGDYVDRGPDSRGVLQFLINGKAEGRDWITLRGNHDQLFLDGIKGQMPDQEKLKWWLNQRMGGSDTLRSFGIEGDARFADFRSAIPSDHLSFLDKLPFSFETDELFFCHAGVQPGIAFGQQAEQDLIWIREPFLSDTSDHGKLVVHGHTPVDFPEHKGNRVALDGGAAWGRKLHVAVFEGREAWLLSGAGRTPLKPLPRDEFEI